MLALPAESKLLLVIFLTGIKEKKTTSARSIGAYQAPWDTLICSSNEIAFHATAAITLIAFRFSSVVAAVPTVGHFREE